VEFVGMKSHREAMALLQRAKFLVIPSLCYEMFPLASVEAFASGKPVVASRLGALAEIVKDGETGLLFEAGNAADLAQKMRFLLANEDLCLAMGRRARAEFEAKYTAARNYDLLMDIYQRTAQ
jgi:glycosyltransferase involved in cell wall biosynthesis